MNKAFTFLLFIFIFTSSSSWGGNIVYPWRSTTAIVKSGETFEVWFNASTGQTVNSIELKSAYTVVSASMSMENGNWTYDVLSGYTYNTRITVTVPSDAPADRYDLVLNTSSGNEISYGGVRVVKEYMDNYYLMHISDGHIYQSGYDPIVLLARKSAMIDMANIMDVQIIMETGDNMYNVRNNPHRLVEYFQGIASQKIKGVADASAAYFLLPGNHDAPISNNYANATKEENSKFFNDHWGMQAASFKYGNGRFMMTNNSWNRNEHVYQAHDAVNWLKDTGAGGNFFVSAAHSRTGLHDIIDNYKPLSLVLAGHNHYISGDNPHEFATGSRKIGYIAASIRDHFRFNLFRVNNNTGEYEVVPHNTAVAHALSKGDINDRSTWELNLTLSYVRNNNGSHTDNAATVVNKFNFPISGARARFVMPKGKEYEIKSGNGTIEQQFDGTDFRIIDVKFDVPASSTRSVFIGALGDTGGGDTASVVITSPDDNATFKNTTDFKLTVDASHPSGFEWMMLWADKANEGELVLYLKDQNPWEFDVSGLSAGTYAFFVKAKDNDGGTSDSEKITVTITDDGVGDSVYVVISSPINNTSFDKPTDFKLTVDASHPSGFQWMRLWADKDNEGWAVLHLLNQGPWVFDVKGLSAGIYSFYVRARDYDGGTTDSEKITVTISVATNINSLSANSINIYPNPVSNDVVSVEFALESFSKVSLSVLDMYGSVVSQPLSHQTFDSGTHKINIPLVNAPAGTYFMQITINDIRQTHKVIVM
jgi:hypothetical protein